MQFNVKSCLTINRIARLNCTIILQLTSKRLGASDGYDLAAKLMLMHIHLCDNIETQTQIIKLKITYVCKNYNRSTENRRNLTRVTKYLEQMKCD